MACAASWPRCGGGCRAEGRSTAQKRKPWRSRDIARSYDVSRSTNFYVKGMIEPHAATTPRGRKAKLSPKEEFHAAIGRFVLEWAGLEFCLDLLLLAARSRHKAYTAEAEAAASIRSENCPHPVRNKGA
jgi:hypothetical protein